MNWIEVELDHVRPISSFNKTDSEKMKKRVIFQFFNHYKGMIKGKKSKYNVHDLAIQRAKIYENQCFKYYPDLVS